MALAERLLSPGRWHLPAAGAALLVAGAAVVLGKTTPLGADPYSGTWPELVASLALVVSAVAFSRWLAGLPSTAWLAPFAATGRLAMTAYVLQSVILRLLEETLLEGQSDDHWWVLGTLTVSIVGLCWAWWATAGQGPLERLLRLPMPLFRRG